jgi:hypothetical protein
MKRFQRVNRIAVFCLLVVLLAALPVQLAHATPIPPQGVYALAANQTTLRVGSWTQGYIMFTNTSSAVMAPAKNTMRCAITLVTGTWPGGLGITDWQNGWVTWVSPGSTEVMKQFVLEAEVPGTYTLSCTTGLYAFPVGSATIVVEP